MIHISSLRKESADGWTKLVADITYGGGGIITYQSRISG